MKTFVIASLAFAAVLAAFAAPAQADEALREMVREEVAKYQAESGGDAKTLRVYWDNGLKFKGKNFKGQIFGRMFFDVAFIDDQDYATASGQNSSQSGVEFRRVRLGTKGQIGKHVGYKVQFDFAHGNVGFRDVYMELNHLRDCFGCGMPNIRVGHFFEPFGLEQNTSSKYITFIERSVVTEAFAPERGSGIMAHDVWRGGQMGYALSLTANETANFNPSHNSNGDANLETHGWGATGRYWWAPWYDCDCACRRLHVGVSASYRGDIGMNSGVRFRARPGIHLFNHRTVNTGTLAAESLLLYGAELAYVNGPWSLQAEYMGAETTAHTGGVDAGFWGFYVQGSYWLSGECRNWKGGVFSRVKPCCDWLDNDCCCKGGWELAVRYSFVDLNDGAVFGGEQTVIEAGVNWHINPNARIMFNVVFASVENRAIVGAPAGAGAAFDEDITAFVSRFQVDF